MTTYPSDFQPAEPGLETVDPGVLLGLDPLLIVIVLALLIAVAVLAWILGRRQLRAEPDAAESIWRAVNDAVQGAMRANTDSIPGKARHLRSVIDHRLGAVLALTGGVSDAVEALDDVLEGRRPGHDAHTKEAHKEGRKETSHAVPAAPAHVTVVSNSHVVIKGDRVKTEDGGHGHDGPADHGHADHGHGDGHGDHGHGDAHRPPHRDDHAHPAPLTRQQEADALRAAVSRLNDHWGQKVERIRQLRAAHRALSHA